MKNFVKASKFSSWTNLTMFNNFKMSAKLSGAQNFLRRTQFFERTNAVEKLNFNYKKGIF